MSTEPELGSYTPQTGSDDYQRLVQGKVSAKDKCLNCLTKVCSLGDTCLAKSQLLACGFATDELFIIMGHFFQLFLVFLSVGCNISVASTNVLANVIIVGIVTNCCLVIPFTIIFVMFKFRDTKDFLAFPVMIFAILTGCSSIVAGVSVLPDTADRASPFFCSRLHWKKNFNLHKRV
jgi:hypothetical protein